jgi:hypothetical protein
MRVNTNACPADVVARLVLVAKLSVVVVFDLILLILLFVGFGE